MLTCTRHKIQIANKIVIQRSQNGDKVSESKRKYVYCLINEMKSEFIKEHNTMMLQYAKDCSNAVKV